MGSVAFLVILRHILEFRWFILFITAMALLVTAIVMFRWPDEFTAFIQLRVTSANNNSSLPQKIREQKILDKVVKSLVLDRYFRTTSQGAARILRTRVLKIKLVPAMNVWVISATVHSPEMATKIVRKFCEAYILEDFIDHLKGPPEWTELWARTHARADTWTFQKTEEVRAFYEHAIDRGINRPGFVQDPALMELNHQITILQQKKDRGIRQDPSSRTIESQINRLKKDLKLRKEYVLSRARAVIAATVNASHIEILGETKAVLSGPDRLFYVYWSGFSALGIMCFLVSFWRNLNRKSL